jgi:hypothetical protein
MSRMFTLDQARELLPDVLEHATEVVRLRADLTELAYAVRTGGSTELGGVPELKAAEARLAEMLGWFDDQGLQVKGFAPLLLDFPADLGAGPVLLCWLEGDRDLRWWHRPELGFAGRRPILP